MDNEPSHEQWRANAAEALEHLDAGLLQLDSLGCHLAAAHMSHAIDALQQQIQLIGCGTFLVQDIEMSA